MGVESLLENRLLGPSLQFWFGTDALGRDLFQRCLEGFFLSLRVSVSASLMTLLMGTLIGYFCALGPRPVRFILDRLINLTLLFPTVLLAILLSAWIGPGTGGLWVALAFSSWGPHARLVRARTLELKQSSLIEAAMALGASKGRVLGRHMLPQLIPLLLASLKIQVPHQILAESFLSFVGVGVQPPQVSLGSLAADGFSRMQSHPHLLFFPALLLSAMILLLNQVQLRRS